MSNPSNIATAITSTEAWKDLLEQILPSQGCWTDEQYLVITEGSNRLVEFTDGFLDALPMPTDHHQAMVEFLFLALRKFIKPRGGTVRFAPLSLRIRPGKFREPDVMLVVSSDDPRRQDRFWIGADLVVEVVSAEKPERDIVEKPADYAAARVPEYWIVNSLTETISVLELEGDAYGKARVFRRGETATSVLLPDFLVAVAEVLDAD